MMEVPADRKRKRYTGESRRTYFRLKARRRELGLPSDDEEPASSDQGVLHDALQRPSEFPRSSGALHGCHNQQGLQALETLTEAQTSCENTTTQQQQSTSSHLSSDEDDGCSETVAHFLEEAPASDSESSDGEQAGTDSDGDSDNGPHGSDDPDDDPDNPDGDLDIDEVSSDSDPSSDEEVVNEFATVHTDMLHRNLRMVQGSRKGDIIAVELASAVRHKKSFESIIDQFKNLNLIFGPKCFPESKTRLWSDILLNKAGIRKYAYCGMRGCGRYLRRLDRIQDRDEIIRCRCGYEVTARKAKYFITLDFKAQLRNFLGIPGMWQQLQYPRTRQKFSNTAIEDLIDGEVYTRLQEEGQPLSNPNNISGVINSDGCNASKKGAIKVHPVFMRINELPPKLRQKFSFLVALFVDRVDPNYQSFLKPVVRQLRHLELEGVNWKPDGINEINSKFITLGFNVDSPVRYSILNMSKWDARAFGCTYCTHRGVRLAGSQRYPEVNLDGIPPFEDRTHEGMVAAMRLALDEGVAVEGHRGSSVLLGLQHLDLMDGQAVDDLHQAHEGCTKDITELLLTTRRARVNRNMSLRQLLAAIDANLMKIKTSSKIARKPRSITKRGSWHGSEWRNWLIFYSVPCLSGLIKPRYLLVLSSLSHSCFLLSQDSIEPEHVHRADTLLRRCGRRFEIIFGREKLKYNLHVTTKHKVGSVRKLGSPWAYSTYNFESLNQGLLGKVTSLNGAKMQIVTRVLLQLTVYSSQYDERLPEHVRLRIQDILNPYKLSNIREVSPHIYLVGNGVARAIRGAEAEVLAREGLYTNNIVQYKSVLIGNTRYRALGVQDDDIKSDDTILYSDQDTYCTIITICSFISNGNEEKFGVFVAEHDVDRIVPVARHLSILLNPGADLNHFLFLTQIRSSAVKVTIGNTVYASGLPNCFEID